MQGGVAVLVFGIHESAPVKKEFDHQRMVLLHDRVQRSFALTVSGIHISSTIEKEFDQLEVAIVSSTVEDSPAQKGIAGHAFDSAIDVRSGIEQLLDHPNIASIDRAI